MKRFVFCGLILLGALSVSAGVRTRAVNRPTAEMTPVAGPWHIGIKTSGGFTGSGSGDMTIDSTGKVTIERLLPAGKTCEFTLTPDELAEVNALVMSIHPDVWFSSYVPADRRELCCDMISAQITIERSEVVSGSSTPQLARYETTLLLGKIPRDTPRDLVEMWNAAGDLKRVYMDRCFSRP